MYNRKILKRYLNNFNGIVVVDEAYIDFASHESLDLQELNEL